MSRFFKSAAFPILIVVVLAFLAVKLVDSGSSNGRHTQLPDAGRRRNPQRRSQVGRTSRTRARRSKSSSRRTTKPSKSATSNQAAPELIKQLKEAGVPYNIESEKSSALFGVLEYILPFLIFIGFWIFLMNQVQGGGTKVMSFGKSRAKRLSADSPKITFRDVAGVDEAVEELHEIKEFLENPKKFQALGAQDSHGRAALRAAGDRQDAARARGRGRGGRAVLLDLGL